jgi:SPP1 gp7 family putative phage head morphogenesis protein
LNKQEKEVLQKQLKREKAVLHRLQVLYNETLKEINIRIKLLQADELTKSRIYRIQYQKALKAQIEAILNKLQADEYSTIQQYLSDSYVSGYVGAMYDMAWQGIPLILPIDQKAAVKAVLTDSKINKDLYTALGVDVGKLKESISAEITRGIAGGMSYSEIARNIRFTTGAPISRVNTIVRTEAHRIQQAAADDARQQAKKKGASIVKQWDATLDSRTRDSHRRLDGQIREVDEYFEVGGKKAMYPGIFGDPAEDCNCRCVATTRARWALDEEELNILKERAKHFGLDKTKDFEEFKKKYLNATKAD